MENQTSCSINLNTILLKEDRERFQNTAVIREILGNARTIAIVGLSTETWRASNMVATYLLDEGYKVVPVNPRASEILGQKSYPDLMSIPFPVDVVDVFRPSSEVGKIIEDSISIRAKVVWLQLRIIDLKAASLGLESGISVIVDKCIKMEHGRFGGSLHWAGMNTEVISARRAKRARTLA